MRPPDVPRARAGAMVRALAAQEPGTSQQIQGGTSNAPTQPEGRRRHATHVRADPNAIWWQVNCRKPVYLASGRHQERKSPAGTFPVSHGQRLRLKLPDFAGRQSQLPGPWRGRWSGAHGCGTAGGQLLVGLTVDAIAFAAREDRLTFLDSWRRKHAFAACVG